MLLCIQAELGDSFWTTGCEGEVTCITSGPKQEELMNFLLSLFSQKHSRLWRLCQPGFLSFCEKESFLLNCTEFVSWR